MIAIVGWLLRLGLGGLFVWAGALKLGDPTQFAIDITNYRLFSSLAPWIAVVLPYVEIGAGVGVIALPRPWRRSAALALGGMMIVFTIAVVSALARHINIDCGCFAKSSSGPVSMLTVLRDLALLGAAFALVVLDRDPK